MADTITIHVRRGRSALHRVLTFQRPENLPVDDILKMDMAIDGHSVRGEIRPFRQLAGGYVGEEDSSPKAPITGFVSIQTNEFNYGSVTEALAEAEKWLIGFLGKYGYEVEFQ